MDATVWLPVLVLGLPFASFGLLAVVAPLRRAGRAAGAVSIAAIAAAFLGAVLVWSVRFTREATWTWIPADDGPTATVGVLVDPLANAMLVLVTLVSRSEEHTSELQSHSDLVCRLLLEKKKKKKYIKY